MDYLVKRSRRRTLCLQITEDMDVLVRAPMTLASREIERFVEKNAGWIEAQRELLRLRRAAHPEPDAAGMEELRRRAREHLPARVEHFSRIMGLVPAAVKITAAKTRFGSCSGKNSICFSCRLMQYPDAAVDYVVVHELAHIVHKNHGKDFYRLVASVLPDYRERRALLRK